MERPESGSDDRVPYSTPPTTQASALTGYSPAQTQPDEMNGPPSAPAAQSPKRRSSSAAFLPSHKAERGGLAAAYARRLPAAETSDAAYHVNDHAEQVALSLQRRNHIALEAALDGTEFLRTTQMVRKCKSVPVLHKQALEVALASRLVKARTEMMRMQAALGKVRKAIARRDPEALSKALSQCPWTDEDETPPEVHSGYTMLETWQAVEEELQPQLREALDARDLDEVRRLYKRLEQEGPAEVQGMKEAKAVLTRGNFGGPAHGDPSAKQEAGSGDVAPPGERSLATVGPKEAQVAVDSPRSLRACLLEGVRPPQLLYRPPKAFREPGLSPRTQERRFELFEANRVKLLEACGRRREALLGEEARLSRTQPLAHHRPGAGDQSKEGLALAARDAALRSDSFANQVGNLQVVYKTSQRWLDKKVGVDRNRIADMAKQSADFLEAKKKFDEKKNFSDDLERYLYEEERKRQKEKWQKQADDKESERKLKLKLFNDYQRKCEKDQAKRDKAEEQRRKEADLWRLKEDKEREELEAREERRVLTLNKSLEEKRAVMRADAAQRILNVQKYRDQRAAEVEEQAKKRQEAGDKAEILRREQEEREEQRMADERAKQQGKALRAVRVAEQKEEKKLELQRNAADVRAKLDAVHREAVQKREDMRNEYAHKRADTNARMEAHMADRARQQAFSNDQKHMQEFNKRTDVDRQRALEHAHRMEMAADSNWKETRMNTLIAEKRQIGQDLKTAQAESTHTRLVLKDEVQRQFKTGKFSVDDLQKKLDSLHRNEPAFMQAQTA